MRSWLFQKSTLLIAFVFDVKRQRVKTEWKNLLFPEYLDMFGRGLWKSVLAVRKIKSCFIIANRTKFHGCLFCTCVCLCKVNFVINYFRIDTINVKKYQDYIHSQFSIRQVYFIYQRSERTFTVDLIVLPLPRL